MGPDATCAVSACERRGVARGWCHAHYKRWLRNGTTGDEPVGVRQARPSKGRTLVCEAPGCDRPTSTGTLCSTHYARMQRHGALDTLTQRGTPVERIMRRVQQPDGEYGCWLSSLGLLPSGYSTVTIWLGNGERYNRRAHRVIFEHFRGPIPDGLVLDHLCSVRNCVNPAHLEPVTPAENTRRGDTPAARTRRTGYCQRGHEMTPDNVLVHHTCRACEQLGRQRRRRSTALAVVA